MRTIVDLPEEQIERLKALSEQSRVSRAELLRRAVAEYLQRHPPANGEAAFGIWRDTPRDGVEYERALRAEWEREGDV